MHKLLAALSKPDKATVRKPKAPACKPAKTKDEIPDLIKKLYGVLQSMVQERDTDSDEESDESEEE